MRRLDDHRKKCEREGRYLEAEAAAVRLAELKTNEASRVRQSIMQRQVATDTTAACTRTLGTATGLTLEESMRAFAPTHLHMLGRLAFLVQL